MASETELDPTQEEVDALRSKVDAREASAGYELKATEDAQSDMAEAKDSRDLARNPII